MNRIFSNICWLLIGALALVSCGGDKDKKPNPASMPVPVSLDTIHPVKAVYYDEYPGNVVALMQVDIRTQTEGYVTGIYFKEGSHVKKGQKLYEIDQSKYQAVYNQSDAGVKVAESNLDQAQKDADRYTYLNEHDAVAKQTLDHAITTLQNAKNAVTSAKQDRTRAQTDLNYSIIRAPFDGTIGISQVKLGNTVAVGQTVLNTISTDDPMAVDFVVNEKDLPRYIGIQNKSIKAVDSLFMISLPGGQLYDKQGEISVIDRGVDPLTGTTKVRLKFPDPDGILRAGMSCNVRVHNQDTGMQIVIPSRATIEQMGEYFVYITRDTVLPVNKDGGKEKKDDKSAETAPAKIAVQKKVLLGKTIGSNVIVKNGLNDGDILIVDGTQKLHDGSVINTSNKPPQQGKPQGK